MLTLGPPSQEMILRAEIDPVLNEMSLPFNERMLDDSLRKYSPSDMTVYKSDPDKIMKYNQEGIDSHEKTTQDFFKNNLPHIIVELSGNQRGLSEKTKLDNTKLDLTKLQSIPDTRKSMSNIGLNQFDSKDDRQFGTQSSITKKNDFKVRAVIENSAFRLNNVNEVNFRDLNFERKINSSSFDENVMMVDFNKAIAKILERRKEKQMLSARKTAHRENVFGNTRHTKNNQELNFRSKDEFDEESKDADMMERGKFNQERFKNNNGNILNKTTMFIPNPNIKLKLSELTDDTYSQEISKEKTLKEQNNLKTRFDPRQRTPYIKERDNRLNFEMKNYKKVNIHANEPQSTNSYKQLSTINAAKIRNYFVPTRVKNTNMRPEINIHNNNMGAKTNYDSHMPDFYSNKRGFVPTQIKLTNNIARSRLTHTVDKEKKSHMINSQKQYFTNEAVEEIAPQNKPQIMKPSIENQIPKHKEISDENGLKIPVEQDFYAEEEKAISREKLRIQKENSMIKMSSNLPIIATNERERRPVQHDRQISGLGNRDAKFNKISYHDVFQVNSLENIKHKIFNREQFNKMKHLTEEDTTTSVQYTTASKTSETKLNLRFENQLQSQDRKEEIDNIKRMNSYVNLKGNFEEESKNIETDNFLQTTKSVIEQIEQYRNHRPYLKYPSQHIDKANILHHINQNSQRPVSHTMNVHSQTTKSFNNLNNTKTQSNDEVNNNANIFIESENKPLSPQENIHKRPTLSEKSAVIADLQQKMTELQDQITQLKNKIARSEDSSYKESLPNTRNEPLDSREIRQRVSADRDYKNNRAAHEATLTHFNKKHSESQREIFDAKKKYQSATESYVPTSKHDIIGHKSSNPANPYKTQHIDKANRPKHEKNSKIESADEEGLSIPVNIDLRSKNRQILRSGNNDNKQMRFHARNALRENKDYGQSHKNISSNPHIVQYNNYNANNHYNIKHVIKYEDMNIRTNEYNFARKVTQNTSNNRNLKVKVDGLIKELNEIENKHKNNFDDSVEDTQQKDKAKGRKYRCTTEEPIPDPEAENFTSPKPQLNARKEEDYEQYNVSEKTRTGDNTDTTKFDANRELDKDNADYMEYRDDMM